MSVLLLRALLSSNLNFSFESFITTVKICFGPNSMCWSYPSKSVSVVQFLLLKNNFQVPRGKVSLDTTCNIFLIRLLQQQFPYCFCTICYINLITLRFGNGSKIFLCDSITVGPNSPVCDISCPESLSSNSIHLVFLHCLLFMKKK